MPESHDCLTAWRQAERLRDTIPRDSANWRDAEREVRHACLVYQAAIARTAAYYREAAESLQSGWLPMLRSISRSPAR